MSQKKRTDCHVVRRREAFVHFPDRGCRRSHKKSKATLKKYERGGTIGRSIFPHFDSHSMTFSSTKPPRPSLRLFSWLAQWTGHRRESEQDVSSSSTSSSNNTTPQTTPPPQPQQHHRTSLEQRRSHDTSTEPINVPRARLSVALSVTDTATDTCYSSSIASSLTEHPHHQQYRHHHQQQQAPPPTVDRLGSSYPDKRVSITSRPASVFSLPPPRLSRDDSAAFCCKDDWPRADRMIIRQELVRLVMDG